MQTLFLICAVAGGTVLVVQVLLLVVGMDGGESDFDAEIADVPEGDSDFVTDSGEGASGDASTVAFTVISLKTVTAFFTFFGLGGLLATGYGLSTVWTLATAFGCGILAFYLVAYLWFALNRLQSRGNVDLRNALGKVGRVYLKIPGTGSGHGKVTVAVQGRTVELRASTDGDEIPTGADVRVVALTSSVSVKVVPVGGNKESN